jgi:ubiquinone/menaquinone biosynthesis C-methylase UbiE
MGIGGWLFASMYDRMTAGVEAAGMAAHREHLVQQATGRVLEVGAGTGANLQYYPADVDALVLVEPEAAMARRLARRVRDQARAAVIVQAPAEYLPFSDRQFDTAVCTLVLCTVGDQLKALREIRRVLKPGGRLLFIEHVRSEQPRLASWQDTLNPLNRFIACGCNCNRATVTAMEGAGFSVPTLVRGEMPKAPAWVRPLVIGAAEPAKV